jgi:hypothetical protein
VAVRAHQLEILESVVAAVAVYVVELKAERLAPPAIDPAPLALIAL